MMKEHVILELAQRYPQLVVPIKKGASQSALYADLVLRGRPICGQTPNFSLNPKDSLQIKDTPAGPVEVLQLHRRVDFVHAVQALAYRCEPKNIPISMGAVTVSGLKDWNKIASHDNMQPSTNKSESDWINQHMTTVDKSKDTLNMIVILSSGPYSAISADEVGEPAAEWLAHSTVIRTYHELAHVISRRLYPNHQQTIRDEIIADYVGIVATYNTYDTKLAKLFLGLKSDGISKNGRLRNYIHEQKALEEAKNRACTLIEKLESFDASFSCEKGRERYFEALLAIESNGIGL